MTVPSPAVATGYGCVICRRPHDPSLHAFGNFACGTCVDRAADSRNRPVVLTALTPFTNAVEARYRDGAEAGEVAADVTTLRTCFIDKHPFHIEAVKGRVVLTSVAEHLDRRREARS